MNQVLVVTMANGAIARQPIGICGGATLALIAGWLPADATLHVEAAVPRGAAITEDDGAA